MGDEYGICSLGNFTDRNLRFVLLVLKVFEDGEDLQKWYNKVKNIEAGFRTIPTNIKMIMEANTH